MVTAFVWMIAITFYLAPVGCWFLLDISTLSNDTIFASILVICVISFTVSIVGSIVPRWFDVILPRRHIPSYLLWWKLAALSSTSMLIAIAAVLQLRDDYFGLCPACFI